MDQFLYVIISAVGDPVLGRWLAIGLFGFSAFALAIAFYFLFSSLYDPVKRRLHKVTGTQDQHGAFYQGVTGYLGGYFVIKDKADEKLSYDRQRLIYAGYQQKDSLAHYYGFKIVLTIGLPLLFFFITSTFFPALPANMFIMIIVSGLLAGFIGPSFYLDKKVAKRQRAIRNSFPDAVDQLIVCIEAGLGIDAALQRVAKDAGLTNEVMGNELGLVNAELRAGVQRDQALKNLVNRTGVEEIRGLVAALTQSMRFGTSIGHTLRVYAEDMRDKRMQRAEEEAAKLSIKMLFPLAFCFFPGIFIVILGPAMINIYANIK